MITSSCIAVLHAVSKPSVYVLCIQLQDLHVGRDDSGTRSGWQLDKVRIDVPEKDEHYIFRCNKWLTASSPEANFKAGTSCLVFLEPALSARQRVRDFNHVILI